MWFVSIIRQNSYKHSCIQSQHTVMKQSNRLDINGTLQELNQVSRSPGDGLITFHQASGCIRRSLPCRQYQRSSGTALNDWQTWRLSNIHTVCRLRSRDPPDLALSTSLQWWCSQLVRPFVCCQTYEHDTSRTNAPSLMAEHVHAARHGTINFGVRRSKIRVFFFIFLYSGWHMLPSYASAEACLTGWPNA